MDTDALYYIADGMTSSYDNVEGSDGQRNDAHLIELASALAVIDFTKDSQIIRGSKIYKEFATEKEANIMDLSLMSPSTRKVLASSLISFYIFSQFYQHHLQSTFGAAWAKARNFKPDMLSEGFYRNLNTFIDWFKDDGKEGWLMEMARNSRAFQPFNLDGYNNIFHSIVGYEPKQVGFFGKLFANKDGFVLIDDEIAISSNGIDKRLSDKDYFMNVHWIGIKNAIVKRLNLV